jgi:hypothetical protein
MIKTIVVLFSLIAVPAIAVENCKPGNTYLTKEGFYGAANQDVFQEIDANHEPKALDLLLKNKVIIKLPAGTNACVAEVNFYAYRKRILIPGFETPYWVPDNALTPVR